MRTRYRILPLLAVVALLGVAVACAPRSATDPQTRRPIDLGAKEIQQYQGKDLSSVMDFRENSIKGPQEVPIDTYRLAVKGKVDNPLSLTYDEVLDRTPYKKVVRLSCVEGWSVDILWEGVRIEDLLEQAGADKNAETIVFRCYDGYTTSLPASFIRDNDILLAYQMNGLDLPTERGYPFQVVAEDKWGYKWARWVTEIEVSDDPKFRGYWEQRGYDNDADLKKN
jgi:DMSO/TMAO reductase YedYZ molybdopterin-dependent catalytic subunit